MLFANEEKKHKEKTTKETRKAQSFSLFHTTQANKKKTIQTLPTLVLKSHLNSNIYNK
jgi:hypothetical protein